MNRPTFETGIPHQKATATWVRRRLADQQGRCFLRDGDQSGVLLADGVGMGKTWEALAATVLILNGMQLKKRKGSVLIICPPNLVTKWEDELSTCSPIQDRTKREDELSTDLSFRDRLQHWVERRQTSTARQIEKTLRSVVPVRRSRHVQTREKYGKHRAESGTYIVSHGLLRRSGDGLSALRQHTWDVIIVDEAHHPSARKALKELVKVKNGCRYKLLLSATPFQLEPKEWNHLAGLIVEGRTAILGRPEIKVYLNAVSARFEDSDAAGPTVKQVRAAEEVLKRIAARTVAAKSPRTYWVLLPDGSQKPIDRIDRLDDKAVQSVFAYIEDSYGRAINNHDFECAYLKKRYSLATCKKPTFVATKLRQFLSRGEPCGVPSPRLVALREWAKRTWFLDLKAALKDGFPRKTIVFTAWVGRDHVGEAEVLKKELSAAFEEALQAVRAKCPLKLEAWRSEGKDWIRSLASKLRIPEIDKNDAWIKQRLPIILDRIANDELNAVIAGSREGFRRRLRVQIQKQLNAIEAAWSDYAISESKNSVEGRGAKRRLNDALGALERWGDKHGLGSVERYTGNENRITRDRAAAGFREVTQPWVLVASNVGAEGIDLQTYTRRIVHYDLEWNPARMEQREGRGDRVGRLLHEELSIIYCLVPRTYDERMFHQLVARDRWHGVLLGKAGARLVADEGMQVRIETAKFIKKARLNLSPR